MQFGRRLTSLPRHLYIGHRPITSLDKRVMVATRRSTSVMPASNRTLLVTSIGLNILLILSFYVFGDATSYYLGTKGMEKEITPVIQIIASAPHPEPTLALSERGRGGEGCTMCGVAPRLCDKIG